MRLRFPRKHITFKRIAIYSKKFNLNGFDDYAFYYPINLHKEEQFLTKHHSREVSCSEELLRNMV